MKIDLPLNKWLQWWDEPTTTTLREEAIERRHRLLYLLVNKQFDNLTEVQRLQAALQDDGHWLLDPAREIARLFEEADDSVAAEKWRELTKSLEIGGKIG